MARTRQHCLCCTARFDNLKKPEPKVIAEYSSKSKTGSVNIKITDENVAGLNEDEKFAYILDRIEWARKLMEV